MPNAWFVQVMGEQIGPLTDDQLRQMATNRRLTADNMIRKEPSLHWVPASRVRGLFAQDVIKRVSTPDLPVIDRSGLSSATGANNKRDDSVPESVDSRPRQPNLIACPDCQKHISINAQSCPHCGHTFFRPNRSVAIALAWLLGGVGAHNFYLRKPGAGVASLLLCWTFIPLLLAVIDGFKYLSMDDDTFLRTFGSVPTAKDINQPEAVLKSAIHPKPKTKLQRVGVVVALLIVVGLLAALSDSDGRRRSQGGNNTSAANASSNAQILLAKTAIEWQTAKYEDKLATCELALYALWNQRALKPHIQNRIKSTDDLAPFARELVVCIDAATRRDQDPVKNQRIFGDVQVQQIAAAGIVTMGWGD
jgi:TM2 domain-containing membrane protein YozV